MKKTIQIEGMGCEHCIHSVREALSKLENVSIETVELGKAVLDLAEDYDMNVIAEVLDEGGYDLV